MWSVATPLPEKPSSFVNDFAMKMSEVERATLNHSLAQFQDKSKVSIVFMTISSAQEYGYSGLIEMGVAVFDQWKIGDKNLSSGILVLIAGATPPYKIRIVTGRGVEGSVPDLIAKDVIEKIMKPIMHSSETGSYARGMTAGAQALMKLTTKEFVGQKVTQQKMEDNSNIVENAVIISLVVIFLGGGILFFIVIPAHRRKIALEKKIADDEERAEKEEEHQALLRQHDESQSFGWAGKERPATHQQSSIRHAAVLSSLPRSSSNNEEHSSYTPSRLSDDDSDRSSSTSISSSFDSSPSFGGSTAGGGAGDD